MYHLSHFHHPLKCTQLVRHIVFINHFLYTLVIHYLYTLCIIALTPSYYIWGMFTKFELLSGGDYWYPRHPCFR
jgi:hypothetical protein